MPQRTFQLALLGMALLMALSGCDTSSSIKQRLTTPPIIPTVTTALPEGWYRSPTPGGRIIREYLRLHCQSFRKSHRIQ